MTTGPQSLKNSDKLNLTNIMQAANAPFRARRTALACSTFDRPSGPHHENPSCHILAEYYVVMVRLCIMKIRHATSWQNICCDRAAIWYRTAYMIGGAGRWTSSRIPNLRTAHASWNNILQPNRPLAINMTPASLSYHPSHQQIVSAWRYSNWALTTGHLLFFLMQLHVTDTPKDLV